MRKPVCVFRCTFVLTAFISNIFHLRLHCNNLQVCLHPPHTHTHTLTQCHWTPDPQYNPTWLPTQKCNTWPHHHMEFFQWWYGRNVGAEEYSALDRSVCEWSCADLVHNRWATIELSRPLGARPRRPNRSDQSAKIDQANTAHSIKTRRNHAPNCPTNHHWH